MLPIVCVLLCGQTPAPCPPTPTGHSWRDRCATIPAGALPMPPGTYLQGWVDAMADRARADEFVIRDREWYLGGTQPGPGGKLHLQRIARTLAQEPYSVVVEITDPPELAETRRRFVVAYLAERGVTDAATRVVVGVPAAEGLRLNDPPRRMGGIGITGGVGGANSMNGFGGLGGGGSIGGGGGFRGY